MQKLLQHLLIIVKSATFLIIFLVLIGVLTISYKSHSNILLAGSGNRFMGIDKAIYNNLSFYQNSNFKFTPTTIPVQVVTPPNISLSEAVINPIPTIPSKPISAPKSTPKQGTKTKKETVRQRVENKQSSVPYEPTMPQGTKYKKLRKTHPLLCKFIMFQQYPPSIDNPAESVLNIGQSSILHAIVQSGKYYQWSGGGVFSKPNAVETNWYSDTAGLFTLAITATDIENDQVTCTKTISVEVVEDELIFIDEE